MDSQDKSNPGLPGVRSDLDNIAKPLQFAAVDAIDPSVAAKLQGAYGAEILKKMDSTSARVKQAASAIIGVDPAKLHQLGAIDPNVAAKLQGAYGPEALKKMDAMSAHLKQVAARIAGVSAYDQVAEKLADQFKSIDAMRLNASEMSRIPEPPRFPEIEPFPELPVVQNPLLETNKRLKSIEQRFDRMEAIALNGAEIATSLQASAATFLDKFEAAASDNDRTTKRAVRIGVFALIVAVLIPALQSLYTEFYRAPSDAVAMQGAISDIKREMESLKQTQMLMADKVADVLTKNGSQVTQGLKEIRDLLAKQKDTATPFKAIAP